MYNATSLDEVSDLVRFVIRNHLRPTGMTNLTCLVWFVADLHARICLALHVATGHQLHESARFVQQCYKSAELLQQQAVRIRSTSRTQRICHRGIDVSVVTYLSLRLMTHSCAVLTTGFLDLPLHRKPCAINTDDGALFGFWLPSAHGRTASV